MGNLQLEKQASKPKQISLKNSKKSWTAFFDVRDEIGREQ